MTALAQRPEVPVRPRTPDRELACAAAGLYSAFRAAALPLSLPGAGSLRDERAQVLAQADDYVLPRLAAIDAPALVVVAGPTGVGKSTLVNSLAGRKVTSPGLLRPTTRSPVLVHHPADREWFGPDRVLPTLDRVDQPTTDPQAIQLVACETVPRGVAILDAPDFDSIDDRNRELATKLLGAADLVLFVTSAARYSDQVAWLQLSLAIERETAVAVVMNRLPAEDRATVMPHLTRMLDRTGVPTDQVFFVEHGPVADDTLLPASYVADVRDWIDTLAASVAERSTAVRQTVRGAVRRAITVAEPVADAARLQVEAVSELLTITAHVYAKASDDLRSALDGGTLVRGDLLVQWRDLVGTDISAAPDALRQRLTRDQSGVEAEVNRLGLALDLALETLLMDHAERAAERAHRELRGTGGGAALLSWSTEDLSGPGRGLASRARKAIRAWRENLATQVADDSKGAAALGAVGCNAIAIALILQASAEPTTDGSGLVATAGKGVTRTLTALLAEERDRYLQPVLDWKLTPDAPTRLRDAANDVARALARHEDASNGRGSWER